MTAQEKAVLVAVALAALAVLAAAAWLLLADDAAPAAAGPFTITGAEDLIAGCIRLTRDAADAD